LDIGVGGGRHTKLLCEFGFRTYGVDISLTGLRWTHEMLHKNGLAADLRKGSMTNLPFDTNHFDAVVSYGVFNYGHREDTRAAIQEVHRVLKTGRRAFIVLRTTHDYRFGKGGKIEPNTFCLTIHETNEYGTIQHFLSEEAVHEYFSSFSQVEFEKTETTFKQRCAVNSDWLINVEK
jgi:SAM-dependent methyltransferase